jgi:hypothetical protein
MDVVVQSRVAVLVAAKVEICSRRVSVSSDEMRWLRWEGRRAGGGGVGGGGQSGG